MSYCRFSTDDFQCDLYCYESVSGGYETHVAGNRLKFKEPLPAPVDYDNSDEFYERYRKVLHMVEEAERIPIGLPSDGLHIIDKTLPDFLETLMELKAEGYKFPDEVIATVEYEIKEKGIQS